jgi:hypothetical protein
MNQSHVNRRDVLAVAAVAAAAIPVFGTVADASQEGGLATTFTKKSAPEWLLAFWKEVDEKTWGKGFDCLTDDAECHLGVSDWRGRETVRNNLRQFVDKRMTTYHEVVEYWDGGLYAGPQCATRHHHGASIRKPSHKQTSA